MLPLNLEKFVSLQFNKYIDENNILIEEQSGFRKNHSCETAVTKFIQDVKKAVDTNQYLIAGFLDFKRAFETLDPKNY